MRIHSVRLTNFRQHADTTIDFDTGLTGIIGANGTGKSTILEAIAWALYGSSAARGTRESIRSLRAAPKAQVRVELDFELGGHRYRVIRGLTNAELYLDRAAAPIANSTTGVTDVLRRRLGMTRDEFFNTYFTGQKELSVMAAMGPTERAQFLSRLLGYERLRVAQEIARDRRKAVVAEANGVKTGMPDQDQVEKAASDARIQLGTASDALQHSEKRAAGAVAAMEMVLPQWQEVQAERELLNRIEADLRVAETEEAARRIDIERQDRELRDLATAEAEMSALREKIAPLAPLRAELETQEKLAREEGKRQTLLQQEKELQREIVRLRERRPQIEDASERETELSRDLKRRKTELAKLEKAFEAARTEWIKDKQEADTKIEQLKEQLAETKKQREIILNEGENGTCPICARSLGDHYRTVLTEIEEQIESITLNGKYFRTRQQQLAKTPADVTAAEEKKTTAAESIVADEKALSKLQLDVQELKKLDADLADRTKKLADVTDQLGQIPSGYSAKLHAELRTKTVELQQLESRAAKLGGALEREAHLRLERDQTMVALQTVQVNLAELRAERASMRGAEGRFEKVRAAYEDAAAKLREADLALATSRAKHASAIAASTVAQKAVADLEKAVARLDELNQERRLHEELDRAYSDLRTDLNLKLRPEISDRASLLLAELTDGRYSEMELDEAYNIVLLEDGLPKNVISGGEEDLANLVLRIAISQMIAERAGQPLSLLILDEVFGSLDESRRANVVALLRGLHERFEQVIVITHVDLHSPDVEHLVHVEYDAESGTSRVSRSTPPDALDDDQFEIEVA
jgi:exonuclease SbcC